MRFRRCLAATGVIVAVLLGVAPTSASADVAGPVVLLGTAGLRWSDVGPDTPALEKLRSEGSSGWLAVRSVRPVTCPVDGWLAISAGRRAADVEVGAKAGRSEPSCRQPQLPSFVGGGSTAGGPATVPQWSDYLAAADDDSFDAHPGLLGSTLSAAGVSSAAVGPGAAIALADTQGKVARVWPGRVDDASGTAAPSALAGDVEAALATDPRLLAVDLGAIRDPARQISGKPALTGAYALPRAQQVQALDARLGLILDRMPANATVIVASIADSGTPSQLQLVAARGLAPVGGSYAASLLGSRSTRQDGLAQTTDVLPTLLTALSVAVPSDAVGSALAPVQGNLSTAQRVQKLNDLDEPTAVITPLIPWIINGLVIVQILLYGVAALILRRRSASGETDLGAGRRRALRRLRLGAVVLASFPVATFLANLLPWWRPDHPRLALAGAVIVFMIAVSALALLGPWRGAVLGPLAVVAALTAGVLTVDAVTGSHLMISSLMGVQPIVAGRFYGFSNTVFALFATGILFTAIVVADQTRLRRRAVLVVAGLGILATVVDGTPGIGSDFGGPPALIPAFAVLALLIAGIRVTWQRALLIAGVTIAVLLALSVLDWMRGPEARTHLGRFVQSAIDGEAWPVISRKGAQNLKILTTSYLSLLVAFAIAFVALVLAKPTAWGVRPLRAAYDRSPVLRQGLIAFAVMVLIAALLNDSGTAVPAYAAMMAIPLLIAACARALELQDDERQAGARQDSTTDVDPGVGPGVDPDDEHLADLSVPLAPAKGKARRLLAGGVALVLVTAGSSGGWSFHRSRNMSEPLRSAVVAIGATGERMSLTAAQPLTPLIPGSRVLASAGAAGQLLAAEQREWLAAGTIPSTSKDLQDMVQTALLDLNTLLLPDGAAVAGWPKSWRYVWPRDASMIAVALWRTGHTDDALKVMQFLQRQLPPGGVFQARYLPDESGVPDSRGEQTDGTGWVLWAAAQMMKDLAPGVERTKFLTQLRPLIDGSTRGALRITDRPGWLPKASQDYWEIRDDRLSLGTAAPLAFGLEAAVKLQAALGNTELSGAAKERAGLLRQSIAQQFGQHGYPRYLGDDKPDAAIAFLLPPFTDRADPKIVTAWREAAGQMARPAGGLAPGAGWKNDGISWTPQTALFALTAASIGDRQTANHWLTWLTNHRTDYGALPEKVLSNGKPAGPAPLAWTDAFVLLAVDTLNGSP